MEGKYSFSASEWQNTNVNMWAEESYQLAKTNVYPDVVPGQALSAAYVNKNVAAIERSMVVGGLRLAYTIQNMFGNGSETPSIEDGVIVDDEGFLQ